MFVQRMFVAAIGCAAAATQIKIAAGQLAETCANGAEGAQLTLRCAAGGVITGVSMKRTPEERPTDPSEEIEQTATEQALSTPDAPWRQELARSREERERGSEPGLLAQASESSILRQMTVPVPPRAEGGLIGSVVQSAVVGGEIMGALVTGPFLVALRGTAGAFDRVLSGVSGPMKSLIRVLMMMLVMALLGGLVAFVFLAALSMKP